MSIIVYHLIYFRHLHSPDSTTICQSEDPSHTGVPVHLPVLWERVLAHDSANGHPHGEKQLQGMQQIVHLTVRLKAAKVLRWAAGAGQWSNRLCRPRTQRKKIFPAMSVRTAWNITWGIRLERSKSNSICEKGFTVNAVLNKHLTTQSFVKPFSYHFCSEEDIWKDILLSTQIIS